MKKLTNESKARFFAQNVGTRFCTDFSNREDLIINGATILNIQTENDLFKTAKAILTPLQNISDEHAIEVARMCGFVVTRLIKKGYTKPHFDLNDGNFGVCYYEDYYNYVTYEAAQYLLSKGYAIPFYCPIENRIIPVQEQIDNGWITLKEE